LKKNCDLDIVQSNFVQLKKLKQDKFSMGKPYQNYRCHRSMVLTMLLAARHKRAHPALIPASKAGTRFTYP